MSSGHVVMKACLVRQRRARRVGRASLRYTGVNSAAGRSNHLILDDTDQDAVQHALHTQQQQISGQASAVPGLASSSASNRPLAQSVAALSAMDSGVIGGGSYTEWSAQGITHGTAGSWQEHAAGHGQAGPASLPVVVPVMARTSTEIAEVHSAFALHFSN